MVDLVIMAALFQAIGIWQRSRAQDRLYNAGQLDAFDPFTEVRFFKQGMKKRGSKYIARKNFEDRIDKHMGLRKDLNLPKVPYNQFRLGELLLHADPEVSAGAQWMLDRYGVLAGSPTQKLEQLADQWRRSWFLGTPESAPIIGLPRDEQQAWRRLEKPRLENLLDELIDEENEKVPALMTQTDVENVLQLLCIAGSAAEFHFARVVTMELLARVPDPSAFWALAAQACRPGPCMGAWRTDIEAMFGAQVQSLHGVCADAHLRRQEMRALCYKAIAEQATGFEDGDLMLTTVLNFLCAVRECGEGLGATAALNRAIDNVDVLAPPSRLPHNKPLPTAASPPTDSEEVEEEDEDSEAELV